MLSSYGGEASTAEGAFVDEVDKIPTADRVTAYASSCTLGEYILSIFDLSLESLAKRFKRFSIYRIF